MSDIKISEMMEMQRELWKLHQSTWPPMEPAYGRDFILYMMEEVGECISILKKKGDQAVFELPEVRAHFVEEMSDVLMYYTEILLRFGITPAEISDSYIQKHFKNMGRDFEKEYEKLYLKAENAFE